METIDVNRYSKSKKFLFGRNFYRALPVIKPVLASAAVFVVVMVGITSFGSLRGLINNSGDVKPNPNQSDCQFSKHKPGRFA